MRRILRPFFHIGALLLWSVVFFLALNVYEVVRWQYVLAHNDFVLSEKGAKPRPIVRPVPAGENLVPTYPKEVNPNPPAHLGPAEPVDRKATLDRAAQRFEGMSEEERHAFDSGLNELTLLVNPEGRVLNAYKPRAELNDSSALRGSFGHVVADLCLANDDSHPSEQIRQVFESGLSFLSPAGEEKPECFVFPLRNSEGRTITAGISTGMTYDILPGSIWDIPNYRFQKSVSVENGNRRTNRFGFRTHDVAVPKPAGVFRIVCVGGSTTEEGTSNEETYPALLENKLRDWFKGSPAIEVLNCGIPAIDSSGERARLFDYLELQPDLILYYHGTNDLCLKRIPEWTESSVWWQKLLRRCPFMRHHYNSLFFPSDTEMAWALHETSFRNLRLMLDTARTRHVDMAFASFAYPDPAILTKQEAEYFDFLTGRASSNEFVTYETYCRALTVFNSMLKDLCEEKGLLYIPVAEKLKGGTESFWDICHIYPHTIAIKTEIMFPYVRDYISLKIKRNPGNS